MASFFFLAPMPSNLSTTMEVKHQLCYLTPPNPTCYTGCAHPEQGGLHRLGLIPLTSDRAMSMRFSCDCDACDGDGQCEFCSVEFHHPRFQSLRRQRSPQPAHQTQKLSVPAAFPKEKPEWVMSGSPQSILSGIGSWSSNGSPTGPSSQVPSPPTTPFGAQNDIWELIYAAAGQVARLKMTNSLGGATEFGGNHGRGGLLGPPRIPSPPRHSGPGLCSNHSFNQFHHVRQDKQVNHLPWSAQPHQPAQHHPHHNHHQQIQNRGRNIVGYERCEHGFNFSQSTWPPLQVQHNHHHHHHHQHPHQQQSQQPQRHNNATVRPVLPIGSNIKRECAGTGVFLPRRYTNPSLPEPRKKAGCPTVLMPAKVVQALNLSFEDMNRHAPPRFTTGLAPDHEALAARRNALLTQQRLGLRTAAEGPVNHEVRLPQEWTY